MSDPEQFAAWFNFYEALFWIGIAIAVPIYQSRRSRRRSRHGWVLGCTFLLFGVSDFIEMRTGAWYSPVGLLILKALCVGIFFFYLLRYWKTLQRDRSA